MATHEHTLSPPPEEERQLQLWMQHAAGFIVFEDVRKYAQDGLDSSLSNEARHAALKAIDDAVYGMMMVFDGISGGLQNQEHRVHLEAAVELTDLKTNELISKMKLADGDGMCMGFHGWCEGDFGKHAPVRR